MSTALSSSHAATISDQDVAYACDLVRRICAQVGPGMPGTPQELLRAEILRGELMEHTGEAAVETFEVAPWAWLGSVRLAAAMVLVAALLWIAAMPLAALVVTVAALLLYVLEFVLGHPILDRWYRHRESANVVATLRGPGLVRRLLIVSGHHDSAPENTWFGLLGRGWVVLSAIGLLGPLALVALSLLAILGIHAGATGWILLGGLVAPSIAYGLFFNRGRQGGGTVPGAIDNLAASAVTVALARFFARHPELLPPATEVRFISFGSEEAGLRGSRAYVARHLAELGRLRARVVNIEMIADQEIAILTSDLNGTVAHSRSLVDRVVAAARLMGVPHRVQRAYPGVGTDAAPFSKAGIAATTLLPLRAHQLVDFYHQPSDRPERLDREAVRNVLMLVSEWIEGGPP